MKRSMHVDILFEIQIKGYLEQLKTSSTESACIARERLKIYKGAKKKWPLSHLRGEYIL